MRARAIELVMRDRARRRCRSITAGVGAASLAAGAVIGADPGMIIGAALALSLATFALTR